MKPLMKPLSIYILALAMLSQSGSAWWIMAGFYLNRDFIAKNQCENRFVANSPCKGQCVLMKKLKALEEQEQRQPDIKLKEVILFSQTDIPGIILDAPDAGLVSDHPYASYVDQYEFQYPHTIFHPPLG